MRLQQILVANSRAEALEQARQLEARAQAQAEHAHFFGTATAAYPGAKPWN
jgi:conjugal transfer/entry exclusion protein